MSNQTLIDSFTQAVPSMFADKEGNLSQFHKDSYKNSFQEFLLKYNDTYSMLENVTMEEVSDEEFVKQFGNCFVAFPKQECEQITSKSKREKYLLDTNLYMVAYLLPGILEMASGRVGKALAEGVCECWNVSFPGTHIQAATSADIDAGFKRKLCYITTATCTALGKQDNCEELVTLRNYRDEQLSNTEEGKQLIADYYNVAPTIVKRIEADEKAKEIYQALYDKYISNCVALIQNGLFEEGLGLYRTMVESLKKEYVYTNVK